MSNSRPRPNEEEVLTSPSSDEKMDTGSESFRSQDTPNSVLSDFDDRDSLEQNVQNVLRLQNPEQNVLRFSEALDNDNKLNDSLITKMSHLSINSKLEGRPRNLGVSPPRFSSTLTLTTDHPLMGLGSPDNNYPDLIPKKLRKVDDDKDLSLSSIEDEKAVDTNGYLYSPQMNTSKNNLFISENFVTAESHILEDIDGTVPPDVARVDKVASQKFWEGTSPQRNVSLLMEMNKDSAMKFSKIGQSTPKNMTVMSIEQEDYHSGVAEWCDSPSQLRSMPNFELPIEMSSAIGNHNDLESPDLLSSSTQEERSAYQALLDPYTGSVVLRHTSPRTPPNTRRKIKLPPEEDRCSLDSVSGCSLQSEEELPELEPLDFAPHPPSDDDTKMYTRSKSTNTVSECSDPIPEYSAAEEYSNERGWLAVPKVGGGHTTCDMKVIEPYKRVLSHGGYDRAGAALIVFSACHLPDGTRPDYTYVMDNLFLYVIWTLERLVTDEYILVYLHGSAGKRKLPSFHWLHECYKLIDRRLRKSLKHLYLVHPTFWLRSFVLLTKPFISSKFFRKLSYVRSLNELLALIPLEPNAIPELVKQYDAGRQ